MASTGSYVVDVRHVVGASGMANYLAKYLVKTMGEDAHAELERMGFQRRFSSSDNWPKSKVESLGTAAGAWLGVVYEGRHSPKSANLAELTKESAGDELLERVGPKIMLEAEKRLEAKALLGLAQGVLKNVDANIRPAGQ